MNRIMFVCIWIALIIISTAACYVVFMPNIVLNLIACAVCGAAIGYSMYHLDRYFEKEDIL